MGEMHGSAWNRGEVYELACLLGIATCFWLIGDMLGVFPIMERLFIESGLSRVIFLGFLMSFALATASALKSCSTVE